MRTRWLAWSVSAVILAVSCSGGLNGVLKKPKPVTETTVLTADRGSVVYSDDFTDSKSGWFTKANGDPSTSYTKSGYVVVAKSLFNNAMASPYDIPKDQLSVSVTATESRDSPSGSGFGAGCTRGPTDPTVHYDLTIVLGSTWEIVRYDDRKGTPAPPNSLKKGTSSRSPGVTPVTVELMCATLSDGVTTRLVGFVDGAQIADITDRVDDLPHLGWLGDLVVGGQDTGAATVTATHFEERDLTG